MTSEKQALLHLTLIENVGPLLIKKILDRLEQQQLSVQDIYHISHHDWCYRFGCTPHQADLLVEGLSDTAYLHAELKYIDRPDVQVVSLFDEDYPPILKEIHAPPAMLYVCGASLNSGKKRLAVVGARKGDEYGRRVVNSFIPPLVNYGWEIVSGGALGIDSMAHQATLDAGGTTVAIIGSGLGCPYPARNRQLFERIIETGGSLVSPFPFMFGALPANFPARNRIISGLSRGCLVVQAAQKSGASITAFHALEQGREVFAVPGPIFDSLSRGCNYLLKQGAAVAASAADIFREFGEEVDYDALMVNAPKAKGVDISGEHTAVNSIMSGLDAQAKMIVQFCTQPISIEQLMTLTNFQLEILQAKLFQLQLDGVLQQTFIGLWVIAK